MKRKVMEMGGMLVLAAVLVLISGSGVSAQVVLTGTSYQQTFDQLGSGLPVGWSVRTNASGSAAGIDATFVSTAVTWSSSSGQFANFAATTGNDGSDFLGTEASGVQGSATNRCLGLRQTTGFGDPGAAFVLQLQDTAGFANFQLALDLNMLSVQGRSTVWTIDYGIGSSPAAFVPVDTHLDPGTFGSTEKVVDFGNALDHQTGPVWIRIAALSGSTGSGSRDTFGIDNVVLSYQPLAAAPAAPWLNIQVVGTNAILSWTNSGYTLETTDLPQGDFHPMNGAASPYTNPISGDARFFRLKAP